ncbi:MAG: ABC transporter substrate-binding protein [Deltaproteobacteria bacterium]|nr:ABC transporter substrate-binding protein [Deltaproteobacteria bacterium]
MRITVLNRIVGSFTLPLLFMLTPTHAGAASPSLLQAKKEAEAKGYIFFTTHDEIVAMAKNEGKLVVMTGLESPNFRPLINGFKQKYLFFTDIQIKEISGTEAFQRFILEMKSGKGNDWDVTDASLDFANEYIPYLMKYDILGMAKHGVLRIEPRMVHPAERNMVSVTSVLTVIPYNRKLISEDKVPAKWEDFLKPEFKGKKFVLDVRPLQVAGLVPAWGLERTVDFARKLAAQQPVWGRGATRVTTAILNGEYPLYVGTNFSSINRGILNTADHPYAALLWLEFLASPEGQEIIDKYEPLRASVFAPGSATEQVTRGKELSVVDWGHFTKFQDYVGKIFAAYGFPKADK